MASNGLSRRKSAGRPPPICKSKAKMPPIPRSSPPKTIHCASYFTDRNLPLYERTVRNLFWMEVGPLAVWFGVDVPPQKPTEAYFWPFHRPWHWNVAIQYYMNPSYQPIMPFPDILLTWLDPFDSGWHSKEIPAAKLEAGFRMTM